MNRTEFETLRDMPGKRIIDVVRFSRRDALRPVLEADNVQVLNDAGLDVRMNLRWNPETDSKTVNVYVPGTGPICRIDVDGARHGAAGRSHKHALESERCPDRNLPSMVVGRADLDGRTIRQIFAEMCRLASIEFTGDFHEPMDIGT